MRQSCRDFYLVVIACALIAGAASAVRADDQLGISEIRPVEEQASSTSEQPSTLAMTSETVTSEQQAVPAAQTTARASAPAAAPTEPKLRVARLPFRRSTTSATMVTRALAEPQVTNQARQALNFYGGNPARATLSQFPRRTPIQAGPPQPMRQQIKPFNTVYRDPTISPYLNLYREESDTEGAPNYFAFVRPQMEQIEANRAQQGEIQQLSRQLRSRSRTPTAAVQYQAVDSPDRSTAARYMDTAQFYGGWSR